MEKGDGFEGMANYYSSLNNFKDLDGFQKYGAEAWALYALQLYFGFEDIEDVASASITDGKNDKKCDIIYIDKGNKRAVIVQSYSSLKEVIPRIAKERKASDLNTAVAWVLAMDLEEIPSIIRERISELRDVILNNEIEQLDVWYIHNCHEHDQIKSEMDAVEQTTNSLLDRHYKENNIKVSALEVGIETVEEWYRSTMAKILVAEEFKVQTLGGYESKTEDWEVFSTAVEAKWIHKMFKLYGEKLFSANIRNYLGSINSKGNVNNGIKNTISKEPENFLVFNNGITALVDSLEIQPRKKVKSKFRQDIEIKGISIVNGAQTTGAIGQFDSIDDEAIIPIRFIQSRERAIVKNIIKFNNSQNVVEVSDFRSTDAIQERLRNEFSEEYPDLKYLGGRRGSVKDAISRDKNLLVSDQVAQSLTAFHGNSLDATHHKSKIWEKDELYSDVFNEKTNSKHIVFVYSMYKALVEYKQSFKDKSKLDAGLTSKEENILKLFSHTGSIYLLVSVISEIIEEIVEKKITSKFSIHFKEELTFEEYIERWKGLFPLFISLAPTALKTALDSKMKVTEDINFSINQLKGQVEATRDSNKDKYNEFKKLIKSN